MQIPAKFWITGKSHGTHNTKSCGCIRSESLSEGPDTKKEEIAWIFYHRTNQFLFLLRQATYAVAPIEEQHATCCPIFWRLMLIGQHRPNVWYLSTELSQL